MKRHLLLASLVVVYTFLILAPDALAQTAPTMTNNPITTAVNWIKDRTGDLALGVTTFSGLALVGGIAAAMAGHLRWGIFYRIGIGLCAITGVTWIIDSLTGG